MGVKRRFSGWRNKTTKAAVGVGAAVKEVGTGDYYLIKGFSFANGHRVKVLAWDKRMTGVPEIRPAEDFNLEFV